MGEVAEKNYTDILVNTLYTMANREIPAEVMDMARKCLLDGMGSMIGGTNWMHERIHRYLDLQPEVKKGATVVNMGREASLQNAALANAMALHVFDIDDGHRFSTVHLAATTVPAVMAVCEYYNLGMEDLLRGIIIGYEVGIRMGNCLQPAHRARGYHSTGTVGTLGAAMGVAAALKFTKEEFKAALSAAATSAAGLNEMMENVSTLKPFNPARACHDGITAALIAKAGFVGPYDSISGTFSFFRAMAETVKPEVLDINVDDSWNIMGGYHKPYAACRHTHAGIDGAFGVIKKYGVKAEDVDHVLVRMYGQGVKGHNYTDIPTPTAGKMSTPFCVGLAFTKGTCGIGAFNEENVADPEVQRICKATEVVPDEEFTSWVPKKRAANVTVFTKDGKSYSEQVDYAKGEPEFPMTLEDFKVKFFELAQYGGKTQAEAEKIADTIMTANGPVSELIDLLK